MKDTTAKLRKYQQRAYESCLQKIDKFGLAFLIGELRTGKTLTALFVAREYCEWQDTVLFLTGKKIIPNVKADFKKTGFQYELICTNYESIHKLDPFIKPSFIILDESHKLGTFPKPNKRTKQIKKLIKRFKLPVLYLTGTPSPESFSQLFYQFWVSGRGPWTRFKNFYSWAKSYVNIGEIYIGNNRKIKDYKDTKTKAQTEFSKFAVTMTQKEAGFNGKIIEKIHTLRLPDECVKLISTIKKKRFDSRRNLTADSAPKLMTAIHQISSGTYIDDDQNRIVISDFKAQYIKKKFKGRKIAIYYVYIAEGDLLKKYFKYWTDDPKYFDYYENVPFICQVVSGKEGIDLRTADDLIFFNINYSSVCYQQARARSQSIDGGDKLVHWLFTDWGIEQDIYQTVLSKENFTSKHFDPENFNF